MRAVPLCICASLLLAIVPWRGLAVEQPEGLTLPPPQQHQRWDGKGSAAGGCPVKLRPVGQCGEDEDCPYQITLPPLTIQLPKQLRLLEKTAKELQNLKETVQKLKSACMECRQQADQGLLPQRDSGESPGTAEQLSPGREERGDGGLSGANGGVVPGGIDVLEMKGKMQRMSASLRNARNQITSLQGRVEELSLINMPNLEAMVDSKVENITGLVNKLSNTCTSQCAVKAPDSQFILAPRDCSDYNVLEERKNGVYRVTPDPKNGTFEVFCDMESFGGGWTVLQQRLDGSVSFNRSWAEYKKGFGDPRGEFWLGNDRIHLLTKAKDMILRIELEDFEGAREYAKYDQFYVANEFLRYRLSISGYSGTAGNAMNFNKHFNHDHQFFTTPDRDNDKYPSGNCGAYYSSGWWFDACMSANLNGKYYHKRYKGVRNGIFWGTWHNMSTEYYPTNYRQAFKTVKIMLRPKNYAP